MRCLTLTGFLGFLERKLDLLWLYGGMEVTLEVKLDGKSALELTLESNRVKHADCSNSNSDDVNARAWVVPQVVEYKRKTWLMLGIRPKRPIEWDCLRANDADVDIEG